MKKIVRNTTGSQKKRAFKRNLLALSTAVLGGVPAFCSAMGLGEIQYKSYLGQPLEAKIDIVNLPADIDVNNLIIRHVDGRVAEDLGVEIISNWHNFEFQLDASQSNYQVQINSRRPVKEPYLNMLVELAWPKGKVYKEYTIFLDPAPSVPQSANNTARTQAPTRENPGQLKQVHTVPQAPSVASGGNYRVSSGDTLYEIAQRVSRENGVKIQQNIDWIFQQNSHAFIDNDLNKLIAGKTLALPASAESVAAINERSQPNDAKQPEGRLILDAPVKVEGEPELAMLAASSGGTLQEQLTTSRAVLDYLVKENRDLKDRLSYLEGSEYLATMKHLVELQKNEIADLRLRLNLSEGNIESDNIAKTEVAAALPARSAPAQVEKALEKPVSSKTVAASVGGNLVNMDAFGGAISTDANTRKPYMLWAMFCGGLLALLGSLLMLRGRKTHVPAGPTSTIPPVEKKVADEPQFAYRDNEKKVGIDEYLDINLALAQKDVLNKVEQLASNDFNLVDDSDIALMTYREENEIGVQKKAPQSSIEDVLDNSAAEQLREGNLEERKKVEYIQQRIKEKTETYNEKTKEQEPRQVEEIELDPEMEKFLKF